MRTVNASNRCYVTSHDSFLTSRVMTDQLERRVVSSSGDPILIIFCWDKQPRSNELTSESLYESFLNWSNENKSCIRVDES